MSVQENASQKSVTIKYQCSESTIDLFGATVTSWKIEEDEKLFVSNASKRDGSKAIRGGIPICFPQFAKVEQPNPAYQLPQHGFARSCYWDYDSTRTVISDEGVTVHFTLTHNQIPEQFISLWRFEFNLVYSVSITSTQLKTMLQVNNLGNKELVITPLLHTYFKVEDIKHTKVTGLKGLHYYDKVLNSKHDMGGDEIIVNQEVDRIYFDKKDELLTLKPNQTDANFKFESVNLNDVVIWNPWNEKTIAMSDMKDDEYNHFICVEIGQTVQPIKVTPSPSQPFVVGQIVTFNKN